MTGIETRVLAALEALGLSYELVEIDPEFADTARFCERYGFPVERSANTILVASKRPPGRTCACAVRANARLDVNHRVKALLGVSRLSFASAEQTVEQTGMEIGGVTVLALPPELPIYVDGGLMRLDWVILGGGGRSTKIKVSPEVFRKLPNAQVIDDLARVEET